MSLRKQILKSSAAVEDVVIFVGSWRLSCVVVVMVEGEGWYLAKTYGSVRIRGIYRYLNEWEDAYGNFVHHCGCSHCASGRTDMPAP